ncbi:MAG TPA: YciI family protein [Actinomycetota bacterium]|jgi:uncharacterized protein YciI|nr:YciI family protein [Actinomycetota bacterium]
MPYIAVFFQEGARVEDEKLHADAHNEFVTSLIRRNLVLLGGAFSESFEGAWAAYVLRCGNPQEALAIAQEDPFVANGVMRPVCVEWQLVGINPDAIDHEAIIRPEDV